MKLKQIDKSLLFSCFDDTFYVIVIGVQDVSSVPADASLGDLGLDSLMGVEVKQTLERDYEIVMAMKDIRQLTINKLKEIAGGATTVSDQTDGSTGSQAGLDDSGISVRYNLSEMMPTADIVKMNEKEGDSPLFVVHPIEGK